LRAIKEISESLSELVEADLKAEETARLELARSATNYSKRAQEVVDGTMSLSAVLMRAGEVDQAKRLLAEVEHDVQSEKTVLLETVQEVRAAKASRHHRMTRLRLARLLATAFLGGSLMMFSAVGVAVAKYFSEDGSGSGRTRALEQDAGNSSFSYSGTLLAQRSKILVVPIAGVEFRLSEKQFAEYQRLAAAKDPALRDFLLSILPSDVVKKLEGVLPTGEIAQVTGAIEGAVADVSTKVRKASRPSTTTSGSTSSSSSSSSSGQSGSSSQSGKSKSSGSDDSEPSPSPSDPGCEDEPSGDEERAVGPVNPQCLPIVGEGKKDGS
jgi:uncharacterized membrane protein YgcG